jgi:hypothetical protein
LLLNLALTVAHVSYSKITYVTQSLCITSLTVSATAPKKINKMWAELMLPATSALLPATDSEDYPSPRKYDNFYLHWYVQKVLIS